jgi:1-aminocyclopropane-1-carboxylate deaminase
MIDFFLQKETPLQALLGHVWQQRGISVFIKREDQRDVFLGGNKWCKLYGHLLAAREQGLDTLVSVGGKYSNHLHALAHAGHRFGFQTRAIIRADEAESTVTLTDLKSLGMQWICVSREEYRQRHLRAWQQKITQKFASAYFIPEGGEGLAAEKGLALLAQELMRQVEEMAVYPKIFVPVGSGTTWLGLRKNLPDFIDVLGYQVFRDKALLPRLSQYISPSQLKIFAAPFDKNHAILPHILQEFKIQFEQEENIPLDHIYMVRILYALQLAIMSGEIPDNSTLIILHTGGLQGRVPI